MVKLAYTPIRDLTPAELSQLPVAEREREFGSAERRRQFVCGRWLLRSMLERWDGRPATSYRLQTSDTGKPVCIGGPAVSITHAGHFVACAIASSGDIGIDLEMIHRRPSTDGIAKRYFSTDELEWLRAQTEDGFFMLWVLKEAYVKAIGSGIVGGLRHFCCTVAPPDITILRCPGDKPALRLHRLGNCFLAIAATAEPLAELDIERWQPDGTRIERDPAVQLLGAA